ncbi:hypothetical protein IE53DRAFT_124226 [Violaceomyces palustris]|uniref:Uncharacterized protein n=1 Tax=Violaceomyces palustris TaxID=1673888 RepID=A0ACD0NVL3_9BASI|nr:hypothetical protein IE53DRAFT_124226 [Violaceomyces palustris]
MPAKVLSSAAQPAVSSSRTRSTVTKRTASTRSTSASATTSSSASTSAPAPASTSASTSTSTSTSVTSATKSLRTKSTATTAGASSTRLHASTVLTISSSSRASGRTVNSKSTTSKAPSTKTSATSNTAASSRAGSVSRNIPNAESKASSTSNPPTISEEQLLAGLKLASSSDPSLPRHLLTILHVSSHSLGVELLSKFPTKVSTSASKASQRSNTSEPKPLIEHVDSTSPAILTSKSSLYCKHIVNTILCSLNELLASGWKFGCSRPPIAAATSRDISTVASSSSPTGRVPLKTKMPSQAQERSVSDISSLTATDNNLMALVDCFRIASRLLLMANSRASSSDTGKGKGLEIETVMVTFTKKLASLEFYSAALEEVAFLRSMLVQGLGDTAESLSRSEPGADLVIFPTALLNGGNLDSIMRVLVLELQSLALVSTLDGLGTQGLVDFASLLREEGGPFTWQTLERQSPSDGKVADRAAYTIERAISKCLHRLGNPSGVPSLMMRSCALELLLEVSDVDLDAFWDRAARVGASHYKTAVNSSSVGPKEAFQQMEGVSKALVEKAAYLDKRAGKHGRALRRGEGFARFCENWIKLATHAGRTTSVDFVTAIMSSLHSCGDDATGSKQIDLALVHTSAILNKAVVGLDRILKGDDASSPEVVEALSNASAALILSSLWPTSAKIDAQLKHYRVIDQIRRRCLKSLEIKEAPNLERPSTPGSRPVTPSRGFGALQETIVRLLGPVLTQLESLFSHLRQDDLKVSVDQSATGFPTASCLMSDVLQTLRQMTHTRFDTRSPDRLQESKTYLERCLEMLRRAVNKVAEGERAENLYYVSASFYNLGAKLYNDRATDLAVQFLLPSCEVGEMAEESYASSKVESAATVEEAKVEEEEKRKALLSRKWDHLAACYRLQRENQKAQDCHKRSLSSQPDALHQQLELAAAKKGISETFSVKPFSSIAQTLKYAVETSVFDLLESQDRGNGQSLCSWLFELAKDAPAAAVGAMLEFSADSLDSEMHREEAPSALSGFLDAARSVYSPEEFPLRHSRTTIRKIELELMSGPQATSVDELLALAQVASTLLSRSDLAQDQGLILFTGHYQASLSLYRAMIEQRRASPGSPQLIVKHVSEACSFLVKSLTSKTTVIAQSMQKETSSGKVPVTALNAKSKKGVAARGTALSRAKTHKAATTPVTPPRKRTGRELTPITNSSATPDRVTPETNPASAAYDNPERLCGQIEMVYEALSAYGHTLASIELLKVLRRLSQASSQDSLSKDVNLRASASLARHYLLLGKPNRASTVLHSAISTCTKTPRGQGISDDTRVRCLLVSAEHLCRTGSVDRAISTYEDAIEIASAIPASESKSKERSWQRVMGRCKSFERQAMAAECYSLILFVKGDMVAAVNAGFKSVKNAIRASSALASLTSSANDKGKGRQKSPDEEGNVFGAAPIDAQPPSIGTMISEVETTKEGKSVKNDEPPQVNLRLAFPVLATLHWRLGKLLLHSYLRVSQLSSVRGIGRESEAFAGEGVELASSLGIQLSLSRALIQRGEVRLQLGQSTGGEEDLVRGLALLQEEWIPEAVILACVRGDSLTKIDNHGEALRAYSAGEATLKALGTSFTDLEALFPSPRPLHRTSSGTPGSRRTSSGMEVLLPEVQSRLLRRQAWLLQLMGRSEEADDLLDKAAYLESDAYGPSSDGKVDQSLIQGRIALRKALQQLESDQVLSMLPEAAISVPMVPSSTSTKNLGTVHQSNSMSVSAIKSATAKLAAADVAFRTALAAGCARSHVIQVREAFMSLALTHTIQATLGKGLKMAAREASALIDSGASVTIDRELLDAIHAKTKSDAPFDKSSDWLRFAKGRIDESLETSMAKLGISDGPTQNSDEIINIKPKSVTEFWEKVKKRHSPAYYTAEVAHLPSLKTPTYLLPRNWTVISISFIANRNTLLISRQTGGAGAEGILAQDPVIFSLPLDRQSRREGEEEELTIQAAKQELEDIIRSSNNSVHCAKDLTGMEARKMWWTQRRELDTRLKNLLEAMQDRWLGAFKSVFTAPFKDDDGVASGLDPLVSMKSLLTTLRSRFDKIIKRACFPTTSSSGKKPQKIKLDDAVFDCFSNLPADCSDEDLEDLLHYVMDALQFSGLQVAVDEIDLDEVALDLRKELEEFRGKIAKAASANSSPILDGDSRCPSSPRSDGSGRDDEKLDGDHHLFLVLDKDTCPFPWESMPILRKRPVSRIPSMAFLQDRIDLARVYHLGPQEQEVTPPTLNFIKGGQSRNRAVSSRSRSKRILVDLAAEEDMDDGEFGLVGAKIMKGLLNEDEEEEAFKKSLECGRLFNLCRGKTFYILNPSGDLVASQKRFEPWLSKRSTTSSSSAGSAHPALPSISSSQLPALGNQSLPTKREEKWKGIVGRPPIINEFANALKESDTLLYFGHSGAEQYIRPSNLHSLRRCGVTMLWGCSSGVLKDQGEFDRIGTALNYMNAGAPALVGSLWDTTDRELDGISEGTLIRVGLMEEDERSAPGVGGGGVTNPSSSKLESSSRCVGGRRRRPCDMSLTRALMEAREECRLPYLTGAACVVYGVPVYWNQDT